MSIYDRLGVRPLINAAGTFTHCGGSLMADEVLQAMREAAGKFVDMIELQQKASRHIADLVGVEGAYITAGAAAGVAICAAASMTGPDSAAADRLPDTEGMNNEIVMQRAHRNGFMRGALTAGARLVEFDGNRDGDRLHDVLSPRTCAYFYFAHCEEMSESLSLEEVVSVCRPRNIPVVVDAAAELPPRTNLSRYLERGADAAIFSGGKQLGGPQASGLIVGTRDFIRACGVNGPPRHSVGRTMKVGKEEIAGLVRAVELYVTLDEKSLYAGWETSARRIASELAGLVPSAGGDGDLGKGGDEAGQRDGMALRLVSRGERGTQPQDVPRVYMDLPQSLLQRRAEIMMSLRRRDPGVIVDTQSRGLAISPQTLRPGEEEMVIAALKEVLTKEMDGVS